MFSSKQTQSLNQELQDAIINVLKTKTVTDINITDENFIKKQWTNIYIGLEAQQLLLNSFNLKNLLFIHESNQ